MKIENSLAVIMERVKQDIIHTRATITALYEQDVEIDYDFSHIPSDKEYRIFITVKAKEKPILDDVEKQYLMQVIEPFRDRIKNIKKVRKPRDNYEYISLRLNSIKGTYEELVSFPLFEKGKMYKGMTAGKAYSLKELGLE